MSASRTYRVVVEVEPEQYHPGAIFGWTTVFSSGRLRAESPTAALVQVVAGLSDEQIAVVWPVDRPLPKPTIYGSPTGETMAATEGPKVDRGGVEFLPSPDPDEDDDEDWRVGYADPRDVAIVREQYRRVGEELRRLVGRSHLARVDEGPLVDTPRLDGETHEITVRDLHALSEPTRLVLRVKHAPDAWHALDGASAAELTEYEDGTRPSALPTRILLDRAGPRRIAGVWGVDGAVRFHGLEAGRRYTIDVDPGGLPIATEVQG